MDSSTQEAIQAVALLSQALHIRTSSSEKSDTLNGAAILLESAARLSPPEFANSNSPLIRGAIHELPKVLALGGITFNQDGTLAVDKALVQAKRTRILSRLLLGAATLRNSTLSKPTDDVCKELQEFLMQDRADHAHLCNFIASSFDLR